MHITVSKMSRVAAIAALALSGSAFAAGQDGQTVFKDPTTGQFRNPTAAQAQELNDQRAAKRNASSLKRTSKTSVPVGAAVRQANGVVRGEPDEESISYSVMTRNAAGELVLQCVTGASAVKETLSTTASTTESKEHQHEVQ